MNVNIRDTLEDFKKEAKSIQHRYYSFDFCYEHFRHSKENNDIDVEKSCYILWSYLASWGMLRGSSFLLKENPAYLRELVEWIYSQPVSTWTIDVADYKEKSDVILDLYSQAKAHLLKGRSHQPVTLVTKVLLGVFAIIPAYDRFFKDTFSKLAGDCSFSTLNKKSLDVIYEFYIQNKEDIDLFSNQYKVLDFNGKETQYHYSKAKIIDMYGFQTVVNKGKFTSEEFGE